MKKVSFKSLDLVSSQAGEAYKTLRTNIRFCGSDIKVVTFTSCLPNEGKSTVVFQVGMSMAEMGQKVLLIDADIRKSVLASRYGLEQKEAGLSEYLSGQCEKEECLCKTNIENMDIILTGRTAPNPSELLSGEKFQILVKELRESYDYIFIDCPPLGSVIDAAIVSTLADGAIMVIANGEVSYKLAANVKNQLAKSGCKILGAVLNKVDFSGKGYSGYYKKYYGQKYSGYYGKGE